VQLYAFDILGLGGELARLQARRPQGIFVAPFEQGEIGPDPFRAACNLGREGLISKRRDRPYHRAVAGWAIPPSTAARIFKGEPWAADAC